MSDKMIGWYVEPKETIEQAIEKAIPYYQDKCNQIPNFVWVNNSQANITIPNLQIIAKKEVFSPKFFYIGTK